MEKSISSHSHTLVQSSTLNPPAKGYNCFATTVHRGAFCFWYITTGISTFHNKLHYRTCHRASPQLLLSTDKCFAVGERQRAEVWLFGF